MYKDVTGDAGMQGGCRGDACGMHRGMPGGMPGEMPDDGIQFIFTFLLKSAFFKLDTTLHNLTGHLAV
jgi:hypothetical protein